MTDRTSEHMRQRPEIVAAKMLSVGEVAVAVSFQNGFIIGRMWLDIIDIPSHVTAAQIQGNNFQAKMWSNLEHCKWIPREDLDDNFERHIRGARQIATQKRLSPPET